MSANKLIIAEKPSVAREIANIVGAKEKKQGYITGQGYYISWCVGHLTELAAPDMYDEAFKKWSLDTLPIIPERFKTVISKGTSQQYKILKELMNSVDVSEVICATDAGREGELIFRRVYDKAGCRKPVKRLWISSMEETAVKRGLAEMKDWRDYDSLYRAADCRQKADWLVGINFTRMYSKLYGATLNTGRVQTPTIALIVNRQAEIDGFKPEKYYSLTANLGNFEAYSKVGSKAEAEDIVARCKGNDAVVKSVEKQRKRENAPPLYDLTSLQRDANRFLGLPAQKTLDAAQNLYEHKVLSYPRTDSRYITSDMEASSKSLIGNLLDGGVYDSVTSAKYNREKITMRQIVNDKKVSDHHALMPTAKLTAQIYNNLSAAEKNIMTLVIYRLISSVYPAHVYMATKAVLDIEGTEFTASGKEILDYGYRTIEERLKSVLRSNPDKSKRSDALNNVILPEMEKGSVFPVKDMSYEEKQTQPPRPYTEDTLLSAMETAGKAIEDSELREAMKDSGLGTPATRASIIEHIIKCGFVERENKNLVPTQTAKTFISLVLDKVKEPEMTAEWEKQLSEIQKGKLSDETFMRGITGFITEVVTETKNKPQSESGNTIFTFVREPIGICPRCGKNVMDQAKAYSCESNLGGRNNKGGCGFAIWKTMSSKTVSVTQAKKLLAKGRTDVLKGFKSKAGKPFDARLVINVKDGNKQVSFEFSNNAADKNM